MSKLTICFIWILILLMPIAGSHQKVQRNLWPIETGAKCGYINKKGETVIAPTYDLCLNFSDGMAGVSIGRKSGYINEAGQLIIPIEFEGFFPEYFFEGLATVKVRSDTGNLLYGYVDKLGALRMIPGASNISYFHEGLAEVQVNGKSGFIGKDLKFVIEPKFDFARSFSAGRAWTSDRLGNETYIDGTGQIVIRNFGKDGSDFSEGFATFRNDYMGYGYIDATGKVIFKRTFSWAGIFKEGLACVKDYDGKWGYIDKSGKYAISPKFDEADDFSQDGSATVRVGEKYGFINRNGEFIIAPQFDKAEWLDGLGLVEIAGIKKYVNSKNVVVFQWMN
ncbi:MAG: hypothetical protein DMF63_15230 [Acidobacteria bacterium]|nr:MAG: hypothetical protein DMF63_15230 [Acidobacteriota bacterium]